MGNQNRLYFKVVHTDSKGGSSVLSCCLKSAQNNTLWHLICNSHAVTTCEHAGNGLWIHLLSCKTGNNEVELNFQTSNAQRMLLL